MEGVKAARVRAEQRSNYRGLVQGAAFFALGFLASRGTVMGSLAPFGASLAAAAPKKRLIWAIAGSSLGYVTLAPSGSFRYLAVLAAIGALRWLLCDIDVVRRSKIYSPLLAFGAVLASGLALLFGSTGTLSSFADCATESVLAGAAAYFMQSTLRLSLSRKPVSAFSRQESAGAVLTGCVLLLSLGSLSFEGISPGRIAAVAAILLCARYGGVNGGAVSGIAAGAAFGLADYGQGYICAAYAFAGLISGLFAPVGKAGCAAAFLLSDALMSLAFGREAALAPVLIEGLIGVFVFMVLPSEVGNIISPVFGGSDSASLSEALRRNIVMRLDFASKAIAGVKNDVRDVSQKLGELYSPTFARVCESVAGEVCSGCGLKMYCYEHEGGVTRDDFMRLEELLSRRGRINDSDVEAAFVKSCCKKGEIACAMTQAYGRMLAAREAENRISDLRGVVAGQFAGVSDILRDLSHEFGSAMKSDEDAAQRVISALTAIGLNVAECVCLLGSGGRMTVELTLAGTVTDELSRGGLMREVSRCCGRRFDLPSVCEQGGRIRLAFCEMPLYDVEIGSDQHIADGGRLCGDCIDYFNDGMGTTYALVCDGMGTGGRAAVDGNMAVSVMGRLLRSGLSADSALQIVNSALMIKSEDESLSTVDLAGVDLYAGTVTLKKAGAAPAYIKKRGRVTSREMPSLPAGILNNIRFSSDTIKLTAGDMIVMVSDGVLTGDERWLERLIRTWNEGSSQELAQAVVQEAVRRRAQTKDDDITAVVMRLTENEE